MLGLITSNNVLTSEDETCVFTMVSVELHTFFCNIKLQNCLLIFERKLFSFLLIVSNTFEIIFSKIQTFLSLLLKIHVK